MDWIESEYKLKMNKKPSATWWEEINGLDSICSDDYSLLYNLIFIHYLAGIYNNQKVQEKVKQNIKASIAKIIQTAT